MKKLIVACSLGLLVLGVARVVWLPWSAQQPTLGTVAPLPLPFDPRLVAGTGPSERVHAALAHRVTVEPRFDASVRRVPGQEYALRFRIVDSGSEAPVSAEEISILLFRAPDAWQWRGSPRPVGQSEFEVSFRPPEPGQFKLLVAVQSRGAPLGAFWPLTLSVVDGAHPSVASPTARSAP